MAFVRLPGLSGKVYVPEPCPAATQKHPCRDCFNCQRCSDDRCGLCRSAVSRPDRNKEENHEADILPR